MLNLCVMIALQLCRRKSFKKGLLVTCLGVYVLCCYVLFLLNGKVENVFVCVHSNKDIHGESRKEGEHKWDKTLTKGCIDTQDCGCSLCYPFNSSLCLKFFLKSKADWKTLSLPNHPFMGQGKAGRKLSKSDFNYCERGLMSMA